MADESKPGKPSHALAQADAAGPALRADTAPQKSGAIVVVGCKLPHGLYIHLHKDGMSNDNRPKPIRVPIRESRIKLNGANASKVVGASGRTLGYGVTEVPADFWAKWMAEVGHAFPAVLNKAIFVQETRNLALGQAMELAPSVKTGFEQLDPDKPGMGVVPDEVAAQAAKGGGQSIHR